MILKKVPKTDEDYIILYSENLKENPKLFEQQKSMINSQLRSSQSFFNNLFGKKGFKEKARKYLRQRKLLKS